MHAPSANGKTLNPSAESWKPEAEGRFQLKPLLPHQIFSPPQSLGFNLYSTLPSLEYYYPSSATDVKYIYLSHQFVPLDPHFYGNLSFTNLPHPNTQISFFYNPLPPKQAVANEVEGVDAVTEVGNVDLPENEKVVSVPGLLEEGRFWTKKMKGFVSTLPPRLLKSGKGITGRFSTSNIWKSNRVSCLKWKPKNFPGKYHEERGVGGGGDGAQVTLLTSVDSSDNDPKKTTVMIKNIPNKLRIDPHLRRYSLILFLDKYCKQHNLEYDFLYLPMDFKRLDNLGYSFVNFTTGRSALKIMELLNNYKWGDKFEVSTSDMKGVVRSKKICEVTWARIQGKEQLVKHFEVSSFTCQTAEYLPVVMDPPRNGSTSLTLPKPIGRLNQLRPYSSPVLPRKNHRVPPTLGQF